MASESSPPARLDQPVRDATVAMLDVSAGYGRKQVLHNVSLAVYPGQVIAIVGPNGAGKTTLVRALTGFIRATNGQVLLQGVDVSQVGASARIRRGMGLVPEGGRAFTGLTVRQNLELGGYWLGSAARTKAMEWIWDLFPILKERSRQHATTLSGGERQMLAIGRALMLRPPLLVLDEPSLGLAPIVLQAVFRRLSDLSRSEQMAILLVEQNVRAAFRVADEAYVMSMGAIVHRVSQPDPDHLTDELARAFVGAGAQAKSSTSAMSAEVGPR